MDTCPICCHAITPRVRCAVQCPDCAAECCASCLKQYLVSIAAEARCMKCLRPFDFEFLSRHVSRNWLLGAYKGHRQTVLLEREKSLLPASQELVQNYKHAKRLRGEAREMRARRMAMYQALAEMDVRIARTERVASRIEDSGFQHRPADADAGEASEEDARERRRFVRACPAEGCRGFLSTAWKCGTCDEWACKDCGEIKGADHACDPDVVRSHALIQKDSRPCPKCAAMIFKIDGCDQMWCTQCHVAFGWRTGELITRGPMHNPHMVEWLRQTRGELPREPGDVVCGGVPATWTVEGFLRGTALHPKCQMIVRSACRVANHVEGVDIPRLRLRAARDATGLMRDSDLRIRFLLNEMGETEWKRCLQQREKRREIAGAELQVFEMFAAATSDILRNMMASGPADDMASFVRELHQLGVYASDCQLAVSARYGVQPRTTHRTMNALRSLHSPSLDVPSCN